MRVFAVISEIPLPALREAIERAYAGGGFYHFNETVSYVRDTESAQGVGNKLGIRTRLADGSIKEGIAQTAVCEIAPGYWGWSRSDLWDWLKRSFEAAA